MIDLQRAGVACGEAHIFREAAAQLKGPGLNYSAAAAVDLVRNVENSAVPCPQRAVVGDGTGNIQEAAGGGDRSVVGQSPGEHAPAADQTARRHRNGVGCQRSPCQLDLAAGPDIRLHDRHLTAGPDGCGRGAVRRGQRTADVEIGRGDARPCTGDGKRPGCAGLRAEVDRTGDVECASGVDRQSTVARRRVADDRRGGGDFAAALDRQAAGSAVAIDQRVSYGPS